MTTEHSTIGKKAGSLGERCHPACIVCGQDTEGGLGLSFRTLDDESVVANFGCEKDYQGYPDRLHGGVVAMLLDAAMTHCLFARGVRAVTARLNIKFNHPVEVGAPAAVRAWLESQFPPLYVLRAEVKQGETVRATADAKFFAPPPENESRRS